MTQLKNEETGHPVWVATVRGQFDNNTGVDWLSAPECPPDFEGRHVSVTWRTASA